MNNEVNTGRKFPSPTTNGWLFALSSFGTCAVQLDVARCWWVMETTSHSENLLISNMASSFTVKTLTNRLEAAIHLRISPNLLSWFTPKYGVSHEAAKIKLEFCLKIEPSSSCHE